MSMQAIHDAILNDAPGEELAKIELPETMKAAFVHRDDVDMFAGLETDDKDPRKSLRIDDVPIPPLGPNEVLIAPMASAINYNTVWTSIFEPVSTFAFLERFG
ncbi:MAG: hypothetical protein R3249_11070, partial [Nitriliruptorales bacterium]|nr:hypothetical protein [Nitriliruptorales bacterium]